jgi:hypothetical protein
VWLVWIQLIVIRVDSCLPTPFQLPVHGSHVCNKISPVGSRLSFVWIVDATLCYVNSFVYDQRVTDIPCFPTRCQRCKSTVLCKSVFGIAVAVVVVVVVLKK